MLSVPWLVGWALRPYIQIDRSAPGSTTSPAAHARDSSSSSSSGKSSSLSVAKAQITRLSSPSAASRSPLPKTYPVSTTPVTAKGSEPSSRPQPSPGQPSSLAKSTAPKTSSAPTQQPGLIVKQAAPVEASLPQYEGPDKLVSTKTINLKMSAEWAKSQLEKFRFSFDEADRDKSGFLSTDEVFNVLTKNGFKGSKDDAKQMFAHLDVNKDDKLSKAEFSAAIDKLPRITVKEYVLRLAFKQIDKDGSGTLTRAEIENASKKDAGLDIAAEKISELLVFLDKDKKDGVIDYEEFLRVFGMQASATVMHQIFKKLDADNSGFLTKEEIMKAVEAESELKLRAAKISDLLVAWHKDKDGKLDYNEFVQVWIKYKN